MDRADEVDVLVEIGAAVVFIERAFEAGIVGLEGVHGVVHDLAQSPGLVGCFSSHVRFSY